MGTIANAKVTHYYNCYNGDFIGCLRILPVVVDDSIRDRRFYIDMVKHWKEQKDKIADDVNTMMSIDSDMVGPLEKVQEEINAIYGFLQKIKDYIDWVNAESLDNLSSSNFQSLIDKIQEKGSVQNIV